MSFVINNAFLESYQRAALANSSSLQQEAQLLYNNSYLARAYFLAVSSIEECGKAYLAFTAKGRNLNNPAIQTGVKRSFEDHSQKISAAFVSWMQRVPLTNLNKASETLITLAVHLKSGREPSMYVDVANDGTITIPAQITRDVAAIDCCRLAKDCLFHTERFLATSQPAQMSVSDDKYFLLGLNKIMKVWKQDDFRLYILMRLTSKSNPFSSTGVVVDYHEQYLSKKRKYIP